jgi:uncharacterized protein with GYD domain
MPFYMLHGRYSPSAIKAMVSNPQDREASAKKLSESLGAKLHSFFFTFGEEDFVAIIEAPDDATAAALSMTVGASGGFSGGATTKLMTSKEAMKAMAAAKKAAESYKPPA